MLRWGASKIFSHSNRGGSEKIVGLGGGPKIRKFIITHLKTMTLISKFLARDNDFPAF